jgi:hypothetical protein
MGGYNVEVRQINLYDPSLSPNKGGPGLEKVVSVFNSVREIGSRKKVKGTTKIA